jgi:hypothetical protein
MKIMKADEFMIRAAFVSALMFAFIATGSAQKVRYNYSHGTDFSKYKTYRWVKAQNVEYPSEILDEQIMRAIDSQLAAKGFTRTETGAPDLLAVYQAGVKQQTQWHAYDYGGGWGWGGWRGWGGYGGYGGYGGGMTTTTSSTIDIGTLNLDFYDVAAKKQVWRGAATKTLDPPKDPAKLQGRIDKAMKKLLKNFPPKRK